MFLHPPQPKGLTGRGMTKVQLTYVSRSSVVLVTLLWGQVHELCFQAVQFSGADIYLHDVYRNFIFRKWLRRIEHFEFDTQHLNYWYFAAAGLSLFDIVSNHFSISTTLKIKKIHHLLLQYFLMFSPQGYPLWNISSYGVVLFSFRCAYIYILYREKFLWQHLDLISRSLVSRQDLLSLYCRARVEGQIVWWEIKSLKDGNYFVL